ncbi:MAG: hypothetical protein ACREAC_15635, partial [Blastocatellia bacterium]
MNSIECHPDLRSLIDSVDIKSAVEYTLLGEARKFEPSTDDSTQQNTQQNGGPISRTDTVLDSVSEPPDSVDSPPSSDPPEEGDPVFLPYLETELYARFYVRPSGEAGRPSDPLTMRDHMN